MDTNSNRRGGNQNSPGNIDGLTKNSAGSESSSRRATKFVEADENYSGWLPGELSGEGPRYLALVNALERDINEGRLSNGFRLPAH